MAQDSLVLAREEQPKHTVSRGSHVSEQVNEAPGRITLDIFLTEAIQVASKVFSSRNPHPFLFQLNESSASQPLWQTSTARISDSSVRNTRPLFVYPVAKRQGANPFGFVTLGRALNNDIVLPYPSVSKFHASLRALGGKWTITDADSVNGTGLDGVRLPSEKPAPIDSGMILELGGSLQFMFLGPSETWDHMKALSRQG